ncbi:hypothetical protein FHX42_004157 [Saccharopolyspora lacisalsi]|uniref:DUF4232 domain-containing protein n=1 Tax=Halosaccharopolyspora lacisalsi TaxID=1000566 RepID=A0A839E7C5_9PSEU|nr:DUF4232 domain-containing protein [Halosaccharopolyspora lacisalsi]MBA8826778.1 hypothetical protein [Halosaccharopolyspora lacisalsi]
MIPHRMETAGLRTLRVSGALLAGVLLAGCAQQATNAGDDTAPARHATATDSTSSAPSSTGTAPTWAEAPATSSTTPRETSTPTSSNTATTQPSQQDSRQPSTVGRCHTSMLEGGLQQGSPGAGQRHARLSLRNTSGQDCTIYGYSGLRLIGQQGEPLPTEVNRTPGQGPEVVRLAPGEAATATLHWSVVPTGDTPSTGPCGYQPSQLMVTPPDETSSLTVDWNGGRICGGGAIDITAFR